MSRYQLDVASTTLTIKLNGEHKQIRLAPLSSDVLRRLEPVRSTMSRRSGTPQIAAEFFSQTMGDHIKTESMAEQSRVLIADYDPDIATIVSQPFTIRTLHDGRLVQHTPDLLLEHMSGEFTLVNVRPAELQHDLAFQRANRLAGAIAQHLGMRYEKCGGYDPMVLTNLRVLNGYKRTWLFNAQDVDLLCAFVTELAPAQLQGLTLEGLLTLLEPHLPQDYARSLVLHALWHNRLHTDLTITLFEDSPIAPQPLRADVSLPTLAVAA